MRNALIVITFLIFSMFAGHASNAELFQLDQVSIEQKFEDLNQLEAFVKEHKVTLTDLNTKPSLREGMDEDFLKTLTTLNNWEPPLGIPSFIWGCCLGWIGILVTYLVTEDKEETKKALWGCLVAGVGYILIYVLYVVFLYSWYASLI